MKQPFNIIGIFCEDIREEKNDVVTLVGLLPDTVNLVTFPSQADSGAMVTMLSKICVYLRINFALEYNLGEIQVRLIMTDGEVVSLGSIGTSVVEQARTEARERGNLLAGVLTRVVLAPVRATAGVLRLEVIINDATYLASALTFTMTPDPNAS